MGGKEAASVTVLGLRGWCELAHSEGHWKETAKITMGKSAVYFWIRGKVPQTTAVIGK